VEAITSLARKVESGLRLRSYCVSSLVKKLRSFDAHPSEVVVSILNRHAPSIRLRKIVTDDIPDVRRTRHECRGVKTEHFLIFRRR
jgi:hypothetical protein